GERGRRHGPPRYRCAPRPASPPCAIAARYSSCECRADPWRHALLRPAIAAVSAGPTPGDMRYCGVDISAKPANQQLVTLHERRGTDGTELVATFYAPGTVEDVARTILSFGGEAV